MRVLVVVRFGSELLLEAQAGGDHRPRAKSPGTRQRGPC